MTKLNFRLFLLAILLLPVLAPQMARAEIPPVLQERRDRLTRGVNIDAWFNNLGQDTDGDGTPDVAEGTFIEDKLRPFLPSGPLGPERGLRHVRLTVSLTEFFGFRITDPRRPGRFISTIPGAPAPEKMAAVNAAVERLRKLGLAVIVCLFDPDPRQEGNPAYIDGLATTWSHLAAYFAGVDPETHQKVREPRQDADFVFLEVLNEPYTPDPQVWYGGQLKILQAMRRNAPDFTLIADASNVVSDPIRAFNRISPAAIEAAVGDANVVYNFHFYAPLAFTHQSRRDDSRLHDLPYPARPQDLKAALDGLHLETVYPPAAAARVRYLTEQDYSYRAEEPTVIDPATWNAQYIARQLDRIALRDVVITINEFGVNRGVSISPRPPAPAYIGVKPLDRATWILDVRTIMEERGIGWSMWEFHQHFGLLFTGEFGNPRDPKTEAALGLSSDSTPPNVNFTASSGSMAPNLYAALQGGVSDSGGAGVNRVDLRVKRNVDGAFWDWTNAQWIAVTPETLHLTVGTTLLNGDTWSRPPGLLPNGAPSNPPVDASRGFDRTYLLAARAYDGAGRAAETSITLSVQRDEAAPAVTISTPDAATPLATFQRLTQARGTTNDLNGAGVAKVTLRLTRLRDNFWWDGAAWQPAASTNAEPLARDTPLAPDDAPLARWTFDFPTPAQGFSSGRYILRATAIDGSGNQSSHSVAFSTDLMVPAAVAITSPAGACLHSLGASIRGTARDDDGGSGIARVDVQIQRAADLKFWTGTAWGERTTLHAAPFAPRAAVNWSLSGNLPVPASDAQSSLVDGKYTIFAYAYDAAGNPYTRASLSVTIDNAAPIVNITAPAKDSTVRDLTLISGTASDLAAGIERVDVQIQQRFGAKLFWTGSGWGAQTNLPAAFPSSTNWQRRASRPSAADLEAGRLYQVRAYAYDKCGNVALSIIQVMANSG